MLSSSCQGPGSLSFTVSRWPAGDIVTYAVPDPISRP